MTATAFILLRRELPETELPENSDYERWYFETQRAAWEAEEQEADRTREQDTL